MAVADQAHGPALPLEAEGRRPRVDDVLPDWVADAAVEHLHALAPAAGHARAERRDLILREDGARPLGGVAGVVGEHVDVDDPGHNEVVVPGQADGGSLVDHLHAPHGVGAVADDVAEAPDLVHLHGIDSLEHRLKCLDVPVHV